MDLSLPSGGDLVMLHPLIANGFCELRQPGRVQLNPVGDGLDLIGGGNKRRIYERADDKLPRSAREGLPGAQSLRVAPVPAAQQHQHRQTACEAAIEAEGHDFLGLLFELLGLLFLESEFLVSVFFSVAFLAASLAFFSPLL